jgi:8-oxo-dGTP diphosphatase
MTTVRFHDPSFFPDEGLIYSVIAGRYLGQWIFVRHHERDTWEIAGGHIEKGESPDETARRELTEETGAGRFDLVCVATYSVEKNGTTGYGRLYFAEVSELDPLQENSEIAEIKLSEHLPENLTYPDIQPHLFNQILDYLINTEL